jgi:lipocalin
VADYGVFANGTISVRNRQRDGSINGAYNGILGWAGLNNRTGLSTADGSLSVYLQLPAPAPQGIAAPYDIIMLGPETYGEFGLYEYAVVSDPFEISLFVLARDVTTFFKRYNQTVFEELQKIGFTRIFNKAKLTVQDGCAPYSETDLWTCVSCRVFSPAPHFSRRR